MRLLSLLQVHIHPAGDVTRVSVMPRKDTVKIRVAENRCRWCRDKNRWKWAKVPVRLVLSLVPLFRFVVHSEARTRLDNLTKIQSSNAWISSWNVQMLHFPLCWESVLGMPRIEIEFEFDMVFCFGMCLAPYGFTCNTLHTLLKVIIL